MTRFNSTSFIDGNPNFVIEDYNGFVDNDGRAYQKVRSIEKDDLYDDILRYVSEKYNPHYITLNIPTANDDGPTIEWINNRTLKLDPGAIDGAIDHKVKLTSDPGLFDRVYTTDDDYHQKSFNEYVYPRAVYVEKLESQSVLNDVNDTVVDTISLKNQIVKLDQYSPVTTLDDAVSIINNINIIESDFNLLKELFYSIYESRRFGDYDLEVVPDFGDEVNPIIPTAGKAHILDEEDLAITKIRFSSNAFVENYFDNLAGDGGAVDYNNATVVNNYLANDFDDTVLRIISSTNEERQFTLDKGTNSEPAIEKIVVGDDICYEFTVSLKEGIEDDNLKDLDLVDFNNTTATPISFTMYRDSNGISNLLKGYMLKTGLKASPESGPDAFTGEIVFKQGLALNNETVSGSTISLNGEKGEKGEVLTSQGDETPVWTDLEEIYVQKAGDTMTGDLLFNSSNIEFQPITDENDVGVDATGRWNYIVSNELKLIDGNGGIIDQVTDDHPFGIRLDISGGNTAHNQLQITSQDQNNDVSSVLTISGGTTPKLNFRSDVDILGIRTPDETDPDDIAVNKGYVDNAVGSASVVDGGCIELNGGYLCGGKPHPTFMETLKGGNITFDEFPAVDNSNDNYIINAIDEKNRIVYRTKRQLKNRRQPIYKTDYKNGLSILYGEVVDYNFEDSSNGEYERVSAGAMSHDKEYTVVGTYFYQFRNAGKTQYVYEYKKSTDRYGKYSVIYGRQGHLECTALLSTKVMGDSPSGYMIGSFKHVGEKNDGFYQYDNSIIIRKYGTSNSHQIKTSSNNYGGFAANYTPYVFAGNTEYDEFFVSLDSPMNKYPLKKIDFTGNYYYNATLTEFLPYSDHIFSVTYLPDSKRYYLSSYKKGYLTVPYEGPLDEKCLNGAIVVEFEDYQQPQIYGTTKTYKRHDHKIRAFEFGGEIVVPSPKLSYTIPDPADNKKRVYLEVPQSFAIFKGGTEFDYYHSSSNYYYQEYTTSWNTVSTETDDDWSGNDFPWDQAVPDYRFKYYHQGPSQLIDDNRVILPAKYYDTNLNTPGVTLPYKQELYWNGVAVKLAE